MERPPELTGKQLTKEVNKKAKEIHKKLPKPTRKKIGKAEGVPANGHEMSVPNLVDKLSPEYVPRTPGQPQTKQEVPTGSLADRARARVKAVADSIEARRSTTPDIPHHLRGFKDAVGAARRAFLEQTRQEAQEAIDTQVNRDIADIEGTASELEQDARAAAKEGDTGLSQQLQEASKALTARLYKEENLKKIRAIASEMPDAELKRWAAEALEEQGKRDSGGKPSIKFSDEGLQDVIEGLAAEMNDRIAVDKEEARKQEEFDKGRAKEIAESDINMRDSDARIDKLRDDLETQEREELLKNDGGIETLSPEQWKADQDAKNPPKESQPEETSNAQWEQHYKDEAAKNKKDYSTDRYNWKMTPEQWNDALRKAAVPPAPEEPAPSKEKFASIEDKKLSEAVKEFGEERNKFRTDLVHTTSILAPEERKGVLERISSVGKAYHSMPMWKKIGVGAAMFGIGTGAMLVGGPTGILASALVYFTGRALTGLGAFAVTETIMTRRGASRRNALLGSLTAGFLAMALMPKVIQYMDESLGINDKLRDLFGIKKPGGAVPGGTTEPKYFPDSGKGNRIVPHLPELTTPPPIAPVPSLEHLFDGRIVVRPEDRLRGLWGIIEQKLSDGKLIDSSTSPQRKNFIIDSLEKKLEALGPAELKKLGFGSGKIGVIRAGESLDLSVFEKNGWLHKLIS